MPKRFTDTEIWEEDWFLEMPFEYKLFWYYVLSVCDHAGIYKVNIRVFSLVNNVEILPEKAIQYFNSGKNRIREIKSNIWFIEDFFSFQYGTVFNVNNRLHASILNIYNKYNIDIKTIRGIIDLKLDLKHEVKDRVKDKDKENKNNTLTNSKYSNEFKGGFGGKKFDTADGQAPKAIKVDENFAYFKDGTKQDLGETQKRYLESGVFKANDIAKTLIF